MNKKLLFSQLLFLTVVVGACTSEDTTPIPTKTTNASGISTPLTESKTTDWNAIAKMTTESEIQNFWHSSKYYFKTTPGFTDEWQGYWPQAHGLELMLDAYMRDSTDYQADVIDKWHNGVKTKNGGTFRNDYFDDMAWNAIATLRTYEMTGDVRYKTAALQLWTWLLGGWSDNICGGGISWSTGSLNFKNAPATNPTGIFAARMYREFGDPKYLDLANKCYNWVKATLFVPSSGFVNDGIRSINGQNVLDRGDYIYNQGTFIGMALELYYITGDKTYLDDAINAADYAVSNKTSGAGILGATDNGDGGLFNGIFIRYFTQLILCKDIDTMSRNTYLYILEKNAISAWSKGCSKDLLFSGDWTKLPSGTIFGNPNIQACTLLEAAALLQREGNIK